jgi:mannonate dehydratase
MVTIRDIKTICTAPEGINLLVVKVETSEPGLYGLGCGTFAYRHLAVKMVVEEYLRPLLIGRDVSDINDIWQLMHQNGYWRNGPIENNAISGVDMALWDIKGKMANMPLYQLFGGKCREGVPVYRHVDGRDLSEICENIAKYREIGVKTIRCQCGGYRKSDAIPKTAIEEIVRLPFEGHLINAPAGYETYLHTLYGDYHQLPPEDQRHPAHVGDAYWR